MTRVVTKIDRSPLSERVAESLRRSFATGTLPPGTRLIETELAEQMGVSRAALREALRVLEIEGLVDVRPNRGTFVAEITQQDVEEIYDLRAILEMYAVQRVAARASAEEIDQLEALVEEMDKATQSKDYGRAADLDLKLHQMLWKMSGNRRLLQMLSAVQSQIRVFFTINTHLYKELVTNAVVDHRAIVETIRARDGQRAGLLMSEHIDHAVTQTREFFHTTQAGHPDQHTKGH